MAKQDNPTYLAFANPYLVCQAQDCHLRAVGYLPPNGKTDVITWPCGHSDDVVSLCGTWSPVDGCSCVTPHGAPPEGDRDRKKGKSEVRHA